MLPGFVRGLQALNIGAGILNRLVSRIKDGSRAPSRRNQVSCFSDYPVYLFSWLNPFSREPTGSPVALLELSDRFRGSVSGALLVKSGARIAGRRGADLFDT